MFARMRQTHGTVSRTITHRNTRTPTLHEPQEDWRDAHPRGSSLAQLPHELGVGFERKPADMTIEG